MAIAFKNKSHFRRDCKVCVESHTKCCLPFRKSIKVRQLEHQDKMMNITINRIWHNFTCRHFNSII